MPHPHEPALASRCAAHLKILCAEDNPVNQRLVRAVLEAAGAEVCIVGNGLEAVDALAAKRFDLVLMDIRMPLMDGLEATREIRRLERFEGRRPTPILALSANALPEHVEASGAAGMDGHVGKPFRPEDLFASISRVVGEAVAAA